MLKRNLSHKKTFILVVSAIAISAVGCASKSTAELDRIHFKFDDASLSADAQKTLKQHAVALKKSQQKGTLIIEGHTDERGTNEYNIALGEKRAKIAQDYLVGKGVAMSRIVTKSWGEEKPLELGQGEKAFAKNRRDEFVAEIVDEQSPQPKRN